MLAPLRVTGRRVIPSLIRGDTVNGGSIVRHATTWLRLGGGPSGADLTVLPSPGRPSTYCRMSGRVTAWLSVNSTSASAGTLTFCPLAGPRLIAPATAPAVAPSAVPTTTPGPVTALMAAPAAAPPTAPLPAPL